MAIGAFFLSLVWKKCLSNLLEDDEPNVQDFRVVERIEDTPYGLHGLVLIK